MRLGARVLGALWLGGTALALACSSTNETTVESCAAGEVRGCQHDSGCTGTKSCMAGGTFGPCTCGDASATGGTGGTAGSGGAAGGTGGTGGSAAGGVSGSGGAGGSTAGAGGASGGAAGTSGTGGSAAGAGGASGGAAGSGGAGGSAAGAGGASGGAAGTSGTGGSADASVDSMGGAAGMDGGSDGAAGMSGASGAGGMADAGPFCGDTVVNQPTEQCDDNLDKCDGCEDCERRRYLSFDGTDGRLEVADVAGAPLKLLSPPYTIEMWFRLDAGDDVVAITRRSATNVGWNASVANNGTLIGGTIFGVFGQTAPVNVQGTGWHHLAWTYDGANGVLFLDGAIEGTHTEAATMGDATTPVTIGALRNGLGMITTYTKGKVDEVRVSNVIRYTSAFTPVRRHTQDGSTLLLLHLDEGSGTSVSDASSQGHTGQLLGTGFSWEIDDGRGGLFCN